MSEYYRPDVFNLRGREEEWKVAQELFSQIDHLYQSYARIHPLPEPDTLLYELNTRYNDGAFPSNYLYISTHCFVENLNLLQDMMTQSRRGEKAFSPYSVGPIARAALVAACRVVFVLLAEDIESNLDKIHVNNADGWHRFTRDSSKFTALQALKFPHEVAKKPVGRAKISETSMCEEAFTYIMRAVGTRYPDYAQDNTLDEMLVWLWQGWSGYTHSLSWPINLPSPSPDLGVTHMPGVWIADFRTLVAVCEIAFEVYHQALTQKTIDFH